MLFEIIILLCSIPIGFLIAWLARDELVVGRRWFVILIIVSVFGGVFFYVTRQQSAILTTIFIMVVSGISLAQSYNMRWTRRKSRKELLVKSKI